jgi:hypothetical protein
MSTPAGRIRPPAVANRLRYGNAAHVVSESGIDCPRIVAEVALSPPPDSTKTRASNVA